MFVAGSVARDAVRHVLDCNDKPVLEDREALRCDESSFTKEMGLAPLYLQPKYLLVVADAVKQKDILRDGD